MYNFTEQNQRDINFLTCEICKYFPNLNKADVYKLLEDYDEYISSSLKAYHSNESNEYLNNPKSPTMTLGKAQTIAQYSKTGSPYENIMGRAYEVDRGPWKSKKAFSGPRFGDYIESGGELVVYQDATNPNKVLKVNVNNNLINLEELRSFNKDFPKSRNTIPFLEHIKLEGFVTEGLRLYPVYSQNKVLPFKRGAYFQLHIFPRIQSSLLEIGFTGNGINSPFKKGKMQLIDMNPENMGMDKLGRIRFIDVMAK